MIRKATFAVLLLTTSALGLRPAAQQLPAPNTGSALPVGAAIALVPTNYPVLSRDVTRLWLAPEVPAGSRAVAPISGFSAAMKLVDDQKFAQALPLLSRLKGEPGPLGEYATYFAAWSELRLGRPEAARAGFRAVLQRQPVGYLSEMAALGEGEAAEALADYAGALTIYERMAAIKTAAPEEVWIRLGRAAKAAGDPQKAGQAFAKVYFEFPLSQQAALAGSEFSQLAVDPAVVEGADRVVLDMKRAESLFNSKRYADARFLFAKLAVSATGSAGDLAQLRLGECDYYLKRARGARDRLRPFTTGGAWQAEALYHYALAARNLGETATYLNSIRRVADEFPDQRWAQEALNNLATHYIVADEEDEADAVLRELYAKYPKGSFAERAAWKVGWRAYGLGRYAETTWMFESAAANFPRSDYRPGWLYWSGRAHEQLENRTVAEERFELAATDYLNSYYGRLAVKELRGRVPAPRVVSDMAAGVPPPPNEGVVRFLLSASRYDDALDELRYAQRVWGDSSPIQATMSWIYRLQGQSQSGPNQFTLLRGSITLMRRAYPQFMAAGGEELPREVLTHIFPLGYWDLIRKHAAAKGLDEYLVAALVAQESTFVPGVRSSAGAVGLMQLMPATGRRYARRLNLRYSTRLLTNPEANVRMGTAYLADSMKEFGAAHLVLASYNAGESRVRRWLAENPNVVDPSEFVENIPFPETQNYVKRILGTAEDYRRLYGTSQAN